MVTITISGVDKTSFVDWTSLKINNILTKQVDTCSFKIRSFNGKSYKPAAGREVIVTDAGTRVFGGMITKVTESSRALNIIEYLCECIDYTRLLDQHLVAKTYRNQTVNQIIADLVATFAPTGVTATQVNAPLLINYIQFKYEPLSDCLRQLAEVGGFDWYIDYTKDIWFKDPELAAAPIDITDTGGTYTQDSLVIRRDNTQLRTSVIVRGGEYLGTQFTAVAVADGKDRTFKLPYRYADFKIKKNGVLQTLGIDGIDDAALDAATIDAVYNFQEKNVRWRDNNKPAAGASLSFSGKPYLPVIVKLKDQSAIDAIFSAEAQGDGKYEYLVVDKSINTKEAARARAQAEINTYGVTLSEGEFGTKTSGFKAGQRVLVNSTSRGTNEYFVVNKVTSSMDTANTMRYQVSLITTKTMNFISVIKKLLLADAKKIEINDDELSDLVEAAPEVISIADALVASLVHNTETETITVTEAFTNNGINFGTIFVLGAQVPSTTKRVFVLNGSHLG